MTAPDLTLSLQFALRHAPDLAARHRAALPRAKVARWIKAALLAGSDGLPGEFTVRIVDAEDGQSLNRDYRQKDYATNVLTFDYSQEPVVAADLVLCAPVIEREAQEQGKTLEAHYAHLLVHGALHAQGYDHETSHADAEEMEGIEIAVMQKLGYGNPYQ
ncbi:MAG: Endoribonuclease YbeY [Paracidovorax wautersii]|uniref:Endoribonuclease YbeY n=1 Tax=Paracidovorax wautersii TaxID=1177982 RepID=A0A7V8FMP8_9BURK|nr:MAG: Endoribonuclease YbeY [Paracidovorax wautersii]